MNVTREAIIAAIREFRVSDGWTGAVPIGDDDAAAIADLIVGAASGIELDSEAARQLDDYVTMTFVARKNPGDTPAAEWEWEQAVERVSGDECVFYAVRDGVTALAAAQGADID